MVKRKLYKWMFKRYTLEFAISNRDFSWQDTWTDQTTVSDWKIC